MSKHYLHKDTKKSLELAAQNPSHAYLLTGKMGSGLLDAAKHMASKITSSGNIIHIQPDEKQSIKISTVRELYSFTRTKQDQKLVIIIDQAHLMLDVAQNALLKLLEEPPEHVVFILITHDPQHILATIKSRTQALRILPITSSQSERLLDDLKVENQTVRRQILFAAEGLPEEMQKLVEDEEYFEKRVVSFRNARHLVQGTTYQKLTVCYKFSKDRPGAISLVSDALNIAKFTLKEKPQARVAKTLDALLLAQDKLQQDGNIRAQLLRLAVSI